MIVQGRLEAGTTNACQHEWMCSERHNHVKYGPLLAPVGGNSVHACTQKDFHRSNFSRTYRTESVFSHLLRRYPRVEPIQWRPRNRLQVLLASFVCFG